MTTVQTIRERQGLGKLTPEEYHQERAARRAKNVANAREIFARNGIDFHDWGEVNGRTHFSIFRGLAEIWYFPEEGIWFNISHIQPQRHYGCRNLVKYIKGECI